MLVAVDIGMLQDDVVANEFVMFLTALKAIDFEVIVAPEVRGKTVYGKSSFDVWKSLCDDIVPFAQQRSKEEFRMYLGRRINAQLTLAAREDASVLVKTVDEVVCFGMPGFLEVLGEARQAGAHTSVLLDIIADSDDVEQTSKLLAYEHAVNDVVTSREPLHTMLVAEGIPGGKIISQDAYWQTLSTRNE